MYKLLFPVLLLANMVTLAQPISYSVANAHSHNDYEQKAPFTTAYKEKFGSMEADIFLVDGELLVSHDQEGLKLHRTLEDLYLKPLQSNIKKNRGYVYADTGRKLQLMIDIKSDAEPTLDKLIEVLKQYPELTTNHKLQITISGNRPDPAKFATYPFYIGFDGDLAKEYTSKALSRIVMMSDDLKKYTQWDGTGNIPGAEFDVLQKLVIHAHGLGISVRFWNAPDFDSGWKQMILLQVDYINTDCITAMSEFISNLTAAAKN